LGFGDEIEAGGATLLKEIRQAVGRSEPRPMGELYDAYLQGARDAQAQFREENPKTALGLELTGGAATGGVGAAKAGVLKAPSLLSAVGRGAAVGGATGAIAGTGYADDADKRASGALQGGAIGTILGLGTGTLAHYITSAGRTRTASAIRNRMKQASIEELGAVGDLGDSPEQLSRAKQAVLKIFEDASDDDILMAANRIEQAAKTKTPITIVEALDVPQGYADAKAISASRGGRNVAQKFLQDRRAGTIDRTGEILDVISPEQSAYAGSRALQEGAEDVLSKAERARLGAASPFYRAARSKDPIIVSDKLNEVLELPKIKKIIAGRRREYPRELPADLPDNHFSVLDHLKRGLDDEIGSARATGKRDLAKSLQGLKKEITDEIDSFTPEYKKARDVYAQHSRTIEALKGGKYGDRRTVGLLEDILKADPEKAGASAKRLIAKSPDQLRHIRQVFARGGPESIGDLRMGVRAALQENLDRVNTGVLDDKGGAIIDRIFGGANTKKKLQALIGRKETDELFKTIDLEGLIARGEKEIGISGAAFGSPSAPILKALGEQRGIFRRILTQSPKSSLKEIFQSLKPTEHQQFTKEIAEELFSVADPKKFRELAKLQLEYNKFVRGYDAFAGAAEAGAEVAAGATAGRLSSELGAAKPAATIGAAGLAAGTVPAWRKYLSDEGVANEAPKTLPRPNSRTGLMSDPKRGLYGGNSKKNNSVGDKVNVKDVEALIDQDPIDAAIYETESNRNPAAKNPKSSAAGGFQLISSTAKSLGVKDPYSLEQSYAGYRRLREETESQFGADPDIIYAGHYLGGPLLRKYLNGGELSRRDKGIIEGFEKVALPRFKRIYAKIIGRTQTT
jgi:hypothetical protein